LDDEYQIPTVSSLLNDLIPAEPPPTPSWASLLWSCSQQPECDIVSDYDVDVVDGRFSGTVAAAGTVTGSNLSGSSSGTNTGDQDLSGLLPYTGATGNVDLGTHNLTTTGKGTFGQFKLTGGITGYLLMSGVDGLALWSSPNSHKHSIIQNYIGGGSDVGSVEIMTDGGAYYSIPDGSIYLDGIFPFLSLTTTRGITSGGHAVKFYDGADTHTYYFDLPPFTDPSVVVTFPPVSGSLWASGNDGTGSGLDADTLDGDHGSAFLKAEVDGVIGNEVTDAADTTLTRTGSGTSGDPWKLKLALANANTWEVNQTAPYWLSSVQYDPNNPRPYGWPLTAANSNDLEFNGANPMTDTADLDSSTTEIPGWITLDTAGLAKQGLAYKTLASAFATDSVIDCRAHISCNAWTNGSTVVLAFLYDNAGSMDGWYVGLKGNNGYWQRGWGTVTNYVLSAPTAATLYDYKPYIGVYRYATGDLYFTDSEDGITWGTYARLTTGANKAFTVFGVGADLSANSTPEVNTVAVDWVRFK